MVVPQQGTKWQLQQNNDIYKCLVSHSHNTTEFLAYTQNNHPNIIG